MNIVFVDIGPGIEECDWLKYAVMQANYWNTCPIYLITDRASLPSDCIAKYAVEIIPTTILEPTKEHLRFQKEYNIRKGLISLALERFFYIDELIRERNLSNTIHLESDCLIYFNLIEAINIFSVNYKNLAAPLDNYWRCIPSIVYINNPDSLRLLIEFIISMNNKITETKIKIVSDMLLLGMYSEQYGKDALDGLPLFPESPYNQNYDQFKSIFDGAALGQYIDGVAPGNRGNVGPGYINMEAGYFFEGARVSWHNKKPFVMCRGENIPVNNLHIHSKRLERFMSCDL